jgi:hypothetical protein
MNEIYDGVITKPELNEDMLAHYGIAKKTHKYIKKYIGKNGKWVYVYKRGAKNDLSRIKDFLNGFKPTTESYITNASTGEKRKATSENTPFTVKKKSLITTNATSTNASTGEKRKVDYSFKKSSEALAKGNRAQKEYEEYKKKYKKK